MRRTNPNDLNPKPNSPSFDYLGGDRVLFSLLILALFSMTSEAVAADSPGTRVLQGGTEATEYIMEGVPKYRDGMMALEAKDYAAAEALFKASAAKLGQGQERSRAVCLYHQAGCLELLGKADDASNVYKSAVNLFERYDPGNPMKAAAIKSVRELPPEKTGIEKDRMMVAPAEMRIQTAIKQNAELAGGSGVPVLDVIDDRAVPQTVLKSFVEMSCNETAELGSNSYNAAQRWQPLMVHNEPAAFTIDQKFPTINVTVNKRRYEVPVELPGLQGLHRILLVSNREKICAIDMDSSESWLLKMKPQKDGTVTGIAWSKLTHIKPGQPPRNRATSQEDNVANGGNSQQSTQEDWNSASRSRNSSASMNAGRSMSGLSKNMSSLDDLENKLGGFRSRESGGTRVRDSQPESSDERRFSNQSSSGNSGGSSDEQDSGF